MTTPSELAAMVNEAVGSDAVRLASDPTFVVEYLPTTVLPIDILLQGGLPLGRFTEVFGDWSTAKSYIGLKAIASAQSRGMTAAVIDTEHAFDPSWASSLGVKVSDLLVQHPENGELAIDTAEALVRGGVDLIVFDSVAATLPQDEQTKRMFKERIQPARLAALMSAAMRRLTAANSKTAILWINQTRVNVGITFGSPEAIPGGKALPYYSSYRVSIRKTGKVTRSVKVHDGDKYVDAKEQTGQKFKATVEKSKLNRPNREVWFDFDLTTGAVDETRFLVAQGLELGIVVTKGQTWTYKDYSKRGKDAFRDSMPDKVRASLEREVRAAHGLPVSKSVRLRKKR